MGELDPDMLFAMVDFNERQIWKISLMKRVRPIAAIVFRIGHATRFLRGGSNYRSVISFVIDSGGPCTNINRCCCATLWECDEEPRSRNREIKNGLPSRNSVVKPRFKVIDSPLRASAILG
jgi:hypothetical protein